MACCFRQLPTKAKFLPDVTTEWFINSSGTIRATFFYRKNVDFFGPTSSSATTTAPTKTIRTGAGIAYRKEFNHLGELFRGNKNRKKQNKTNTVAPTAEINQTQETKNSNQ